ncbi:DMT family transporter [Yoonia sp. BS5-3]|uniref:EamA family transporter n=1 Tax=Yoonia phaeophyticola TaxID=3137369 RepID=A0ABZ2V5Z7_9RHOB
MSLILGLIAAACWGLHDFCIRLTSQSTPISAAMIAVMIFGLLFQTTLLVATSNYTPLPPNSFAQILFAGVSFAAANCGLYVAFQRGPVWLAAPLVACFCVFSVGIAMFGGATVSVGQLTAVGVILCGITMIAVLADRDDDHETSYFWTIVSALICAAAFASTFHFGQSATELTNGLVSAIITRIVAIGVLLTGFWTLRLPLWPAVSSLGAFAVMGVLDGVAIFSIMSAGNHPNPEYASVTTAMYGLPTIWLAAFFLKERINAVQWLGCLIAFFGVGYLSL